LYAGSAVATVRRRTAATSVAGNLIKLIVESDF
jgi:hypothetical protein